MMSHKQFKMDNYWLSKAILTSNSFEELEEVYKDINDNAKVEKTVKPFPVLIVRVNNIQAIQCKRKSLLANMKSKL